MGMANPLLGSSGDKLAFTFITPTSVVVGGTATASFDLQSDGDIDGTATNNTIADRDDWITPKVNMASYEVRATLQSGGPMSTGTMGSYVALSSNRVWTLQQIGVGSITAVVRFEFRRTGQVDILLSKDVTFQAIVS